MYPIALRSAAEKLQALLHRKPSNREIADVLGVRVDDISAILGEAYGYNFVRINDGFDSKEQEPEYMAGYNVFCAIEFYLYFWNNTGTPSLGVSLSGVSIT